MLKAGRVGAAKKEKLPLPLVCHPRTVQPLLNPNHTSREWSLQGKVRVSKHLRLAGLSAGPGS